MEGWHTEAHFLHLQTSTLCIKTKGAITFLCWPQPSPRGIRDCDAGGSWMEQGSQPYGGPQGMVSAARLGVLGLQRPCVCPQAWRQSPSAQAGTGPSLQQTTGRAWLNLGNFAWSSMELHKRGVLSLVPRQWEQGEVGLKEISAALRFPSKYLIREMFDFNNKWAEYQETWVLVK